MKNRDLYLVGMVLSLLLTLPSCGGSGDSEENDKSGDGDGDGDGSGDGDGDGSGDGDGDGDRGSTTCGISTCESGQHCNNGLCVNGCLTAENCSSDQTCEDIDDFSKIGTCKSAPTQPDPVEKDCTAFCAKMEACREPEAEYCQDACTALSSACVTCYNDSNCGDGCEAVCDL